MEQVLAIYDISGIQSFIFATNKLREMAGGSEIVHRALFEFIPEKLGYGKSSWQDEEFSNVIDNERQGNIIYIGGGNALVLFKNKATYKTVTIDLQKEIFELSGGGIRLCHAAIEAPDLGEIRNFVDVIQRPLMQKLTLYKQNNPPIQTVRGFAFGAQDAETQEPLICVAEEGEQVWRSEKESSASLALYASYSRYKKDQIFYESKNKEKSPDSIKQYFADNFEQFRDKDEKSFVAVVHIDGNTMGKQIINFANGLKATPLTNQLNEMRSLSKEIASVYTNTLYATVNEIFKNEIANVKKNSGNGTIPYREILADGDDITIIIKANKALKFCETFVKKLEDQNSKNYLILQNFHLSVGIGIAFVHDKFPFSTAYDIAEQLCKNAKKRGLEDTSSTTPPSSMDFQIVKSGMTTDVKTFRENNYILPDGKQLHFRPYVYRLGSHDYQHLIDTYEELSKISKNKLRDLYYAYSCNESEVDYVIQMIKARTRVELEAWEPKENNGDKVRFAKYFDVLDIFDYYDGGSA